MLLQWGADARNAVLFMQPPRVSLLAAAAALFCVVFGLFHKQLMLNRLAGAMLRFAGITLNTGKAQRGVKLLHCLKH
jgi:hypothetical protein